jgi:hypothetical protein
VTQVLGEVAADDIRLVTAALEVRVRPSRGCDIVSVIDRATETELMFRSPWAGSVPAEVGWDDASRWLAGYPGGWQVLCPNAGPGRDVDGAFQGFHGEAAVRPWRVLSCDVSTVTAEVELFTAPLHLTRTVRVDGPVLTVNDTVQNRSGHDRAVAWVQHIGFGAPLLDASSRLYLPECTVLADPDAPGTVLPAGSSHRWPDAHTTNGDRIDLSRVPAEPREVFAAVTGFDAGWCAVVNESRGVGAALRWDAHTYPHAWLWQELHATQTFPWFGRAYVLGVEPANVLPDHGRSRPPPPVLPAGEQRCTTVELTVFKPAGAVVHVEAGGTLTYASQTDDARSPDAG